MRVVVIAACVLMLAGAAQAQQVINPTAVQFTASADHTDVTSYIIGYFLPGASNPVQEADLGKPTPDGSNVITAPIAIRPLGFGQGFTAKVRAVAGSASSEWSLASNPFGRVPAAPANVTVSR